MRIDHVTFAGRDLDTLVRRFRAAGLESVYGGAHSNGVTHMAIVSFADGSYLELISTIEPAATSSWWNRAIAEDAGPCAWALSVDDVAAEAGRCAALGVAVGGPIAMSRALPDGRVAEWSLAHLGEGEPGSRLPFLIEDRTPRSIRVPPPTTDRATGVATVVVGVEALAPAVEEYRRVFDLGEPDVVDGVSRFADAPVALVESATPGPIRFELRSSATAPAGPDLEPFVVFV